MILAQYTHRLPTDYDTGIITARVREKGPLWDDLAELHFKAFLLRERGKQGATGNDYTCLYLWRRDAALTEMLLSARFKGVIESFGRPAVETRLAIDARRGNGRDAKVAIIETSPIGLDADLSRVVEEESARNKDSAAAKGTIVSVVALDVARWQVVRTLVAEDFPGAATGDVYQVMHLSKPLMSELPTV